MPRTQDAWQWISLAELIVEIGLGAGIFFMAVLDVYYVSPTIELIIQALLFAISLIMWLLLSCSYNADKRSSVQQRGSSAIRQFSVYFLLVWVSHAVLVVGWIIHVAKFSNLTPLNFTTNQDAHHVRRSLDFLSLLVVMLLLLFSIYDRRHARLSRYVTTTLNTQR